MNFRNILLILCIVILFSSLIAVSANGSQFIMHDIESVLLDNDVDDMTGCCSVLYQEDGANAMMAFRRDANSSDDIHIEKIKWHGKDAIKQYKKTGGYFCQVIITEDGWMLGYGGTDDGPDNEEIENLTGEMIENNNAIKEDVLAEIQEIKRPYNLGHLIVKAPNGDYGVATDKEHFTGKLKPGDYISMPNRYKYSRTGNLTLNASSDKIKTMNELAISDVFGITRRDVTVFDFDVTDEGNVTQLYVSNDDGSMHGANTAGLYDNIIFNGTTINGEGLPISPAYKQLGNITFPANNTAKGGSGSFMLILSYAIISIVIGVVSYASYQIVRYFMRLRRYRRNQRYRNNRKYRR